MHRVFVGILKTVYKMLRRCNGTSSLFSHVVGFWVLLWTVIRKLKPSSFHLRVLNKTLQNFIFWLLRNSINANTKYIYIAWIKTARFVCLRELEPKYSVPCSASVVDTDLGYFSRDLLNQVQWQILLFLFWSSWHGPARVPVHCQWHILFLSTLTCALWGVSDISSPSRNEGVTWNPWCILQCIFWLSLS